VQLKSGGPIMTVEAGDPVAHWGIQATWFAYGKCRSTQFDVQALQAATAPQKGRKAK
jgi:uncharacterized protein YodC (DUF2158 family)